MSWRGAILLALLPSCAASAPAARAPRGGDAPTARGIERAVECHTTFRATGDAARDTTRLARACGATERLGEPRAGSQSAEAPVASFVFAASAGDCYRVFAVAGDGVVELDTMVRDPDGRPLVRDEGVGRIAVAPHAGALCVVTDGAYTIDVAVVRGAGPFSVELWRQ